MYENIKNSQECTKKTVFIQILTSNITDLQLYTVYFSVIRIHGNYDTYRTKIATLWVQNRVQVWTDKGYNRVRSDIHISNTRLSYTRLYFY